MLHEMSKFCDLTHPTDQRITLQFFRGILKAATVPKTVKSCDMIQARHANLGFCWPRERARYHS
jgi:hypothetical protein